MADGSNFGSDSDVDDRGPPLRIYCIFLIILTLLSISLRFWSRSLLQTRRRFWWDDWAALVAMLFTLGQLILAIVIVHLGVGKHIQNIDRSNYLGLGRSLYVMFLIYGLALTTSKLSALLFFSRVFPSFTTNRKFRVALWVIHGLNVAWLIAYTLIKILQCNQTPQFWDYNVNKGKCSKQSPLQMGLALASVAIDLMILVLPVPSIVRLHTSKSRKAGIIIVFTLGYGVIAVSIGRLVTVVQIEEDVKKDITYHITKFCWWGLLEAPITLFGACLPAMAVLGRKARHIFFFKFINKEKTNDSLRPKEISKSGGPLPSIRLGSIDSLNPTSRTDF